MLINKHKKLTQEFAPDREVLTPLEYYDLFSKATKREKAARMQHAATKLVDAFEAVQESKDQNWGTPVGFVLKVNEEGRSVLTEAPEGVKPAFRVERISLPTVVDITPAQGPDGTRKPEKRYTEIPSLDANKYVVDFPSSGDDLMKLEMQTDDDGPYTFNYWDSRWKEGFIMNTSYTSYVSPLFVANMRQLSQSEIQVAGTVEQHLPS